MPKLAHLNAEPTRWSPLGVRVRLSADAKNPAIHAEPAFLKGTIEIQDEGSQLAALFAGAKPGEQVVDLAAGAGGKTLALAAATENRGQIYATDIDKRQLAPIHERIARAGARNIQVRTPRGEADVLADLAGRIDLGIDRRAVHRNRRLAAQPGCQVARAPGRAGGAAQTASRTARSRRRAGKEPAAASPTSPARFWKRKMATRFGTSSPRHREFTRRAAPRSCCRKRSASARVLFCRAALLSEQGLLMTPRRTDTDGFYVAVMRKT